MLPKSSPTERLKRRSSKEEQSFLEQTRLLAASARPSHAYTGWLALGVDVGRGGRHSQGGGPKGRAAALLSVVTDKQPCYGNQNALSSHPHCRASSPGPLLSTVGTSPGSRPVDWKVSIVLPIRITF